MNNFYTIRITYEKYWFYVKFDFPILVIKSRLYHVQSKKNISNLLHLIGGFVLKEAAQFTLIRSCKITFLIYQTSF